MLLGFVVLVIGVRGVLSIVRGPQSAVSAASAVAAWPDDEAQAFAMRFARAYLTWSPSRPDDTAKAVGAMLAADLRSDAVGWPTGSAARAQRVLQASVARVGRLSPQRALITVAVDVSSRGAASTRYLSVVVARDRVGGLVIDDYPSVASPPRVSASSPDTGERPLAGDGDADAIEALLARFLAQYLRGDAVAPEFLVPGATVTPLGYGYELRELVSIAQDGPGVVSRRILAQVRVRDVRTGAEYVLRERVAVVWRDRWLVNYIEGSGAS